MQQAPADMTPEDLSHAGSVVDKAIEYMMEQQIAPISIASAASEGRPMPASTMIGAAISSIKILISSLV